MATSVVMPALEMAQETGKLVKWFAREGQSVSRGDLLMSIETDKAVVDVEADAAGILSGVTAQEGDVITVGQVIAWILAPGEAVPQESRPQLSGRTPTTRPAAGPAVPPPVAPKADAGAARLSPKARRLAAERGVDVRAVAGSGPGGAIVAADLESSAAVAPPGEEPSTVWRIMAERMSAAWSAVPHFFLVRDVDATALASARARLVAGRPAGVGPAVTYSDLLVALAARTLARHPQVRTRWVAGRLVRHDGCNIGLATAVEHGLVVPVIAGADGLPVSEIASRRDELVAKARAGRLSPADIGGGTFTISNLGMYAVDAFAAVVNAPQAATLAVGRITERVVAKDGQAVVRLMLTLTLSCDHRALDGARGAAFLADLAAAIEDPDPVLGGA
ncbi:MAG: dihydrolipoamide acetyltransferase family protein [Acidobacteriota bacterium]